MSTSRSGNYHLRIRPMGGSAADDRRIYLMGKTSLIKEIRAHVQAHLGLDSPSNIMLMRNTIIMDDCSANKKNHTLFDYKINVDDLVFFSVNTKSTTTIQPDPVRYPWDCKPSTPPPSHIHMNADEKENTLCKKCKPRPSLASRPTCNICGCQVCNRLDGDPDRMVVCDECDSSYHFECVGLCSLPDIDWYGPCCKNSDQVQVSTRKIDPRSKAAQTTSTTWGRGLACAAVPSGAKDHIDKNLRGRIPGVSVGQTWQNRRLLASSGVHRAPVAGMCGGKEAGGVLSIVVSGGYEDNVDNGNTLVYTGSGGRDLQKDEKNLRTAPQSCDQKLEKMNLNMAKTCDAPVSEKGAVARDWRKSKPIRVVRSQGKTKARQQANKYGPKVGLRYDGLYKMVKYEFNKGKSGLGVWQFTLKRDDLDPAPWTEEGEEFVLLNKLQMVCEEGDVAPCSSSKRPLSDSDTSEQPPRQRPRQQLVISDELTHAASLDTDPARQSHYTDFFTSQNENGAVGSEVVRFIFELFKCGLCHNDGAGIVSYPCHHLYCEVCVLETLRNGIDKCPLCKAAHGLTRESKLTSNPIIVEILRWATERPVQIAAVNAAASTDK